MFYTSSGYNGYAYMDEFRLSRWCGEEFTVTLGDEEAYSTDSSDPLMPAALELYQNYPNPFNPVTTIRYRLEHRSHVTLEIYDVNGGIVSRIFEGERKAGLNSVTWDGRNESGAAVASGIYFCRLGAGRLSVSKKMILLR
jgi:cytochrome bd-type quinol oxidase subunit 1